MIYALPKPPPQDQQHIIEEEEEPSTSPTNNTTIIYASQVAESIKTTMYYNATHVTGEYPIYLEYTKVSQAVLTPSMHFLILILFVGSHDHSASSAKRTAILLP